MVSVVKVLGGPSCFPFHGEAFVTKDGEIYFCEIGSRIGIICLFSFFFSFSFFLCARLGLTVLGGASVRHQIWNLFSIMPDKTYSQWQCQDVITNEELGTNWEGIKKTKGFLLVLIFRAIS
jgi:hypothetical protein